MEQERLEGLISLTSVSATLTSDTIPNSEPITALTSNGVGLFYCLKSTPHFMPRQILKVLINLAEYALTQHLIDDRFLINLPAPFGELTCGVRDAIARLNPYCQVRERDGF
jgi:hypothetical protein